MAGDQLAKAFRQALCGRARPVEGRIIWADGGDRIVLLVDELQVRSAGGVLVVAVDTESVEHGTAPLIARFVFGTGKDPASLVAASDATALGQPQVAARWGELFRSVIWAAFARLVETTAAGQAPSQMTLHPDRLELTVQERASQLDLAHAHLAGGPA